MSRMALCDHEPGSYITARHSCFEELLSSLSCVILEHTQTKDNLASLQLSYVILSALHQVL